MKLKPSDRPKKRYIVFEVISEDLKTGSAIFHAIQKSALDVLGPKYPQAGIRFLNDKYKPSTQRGIFRVNNKFAKTMIDALNKERYFRTVGMSGILKKAENKYLKIAS